MKPDGPDLILRIVNESSETFCVFVEPQADEMHLAPGDDVEIKGEYDRETGVDIELETGLWAIWPEAGGHLILPGGFYDSKDEPLENVFAFALRKVLAWVRRR